MNGRVADRQSGRVAEWQKLDADKMPRPHTPSTVMPGHEVANEKRVLADREVADISTE